MLFVRRRRRGGLSSFLRLLLEVVMLIGPFSEWRPGRRLRFIVSRSIRERVPETMVRLDPARIQGVWKFPAGSLTPEYYVAYDTDNVSFYKNYLTTLPEGAEPVDKIESVTGCVIEGRYVGNSDVCNEYLLFEPGEVERVDRRTWWRRPERPKEVEMEGEPELTVVTKNNFGYAARQFFGGEVDEYSWRVAGHDAPIIIAKAGERNVRIGETVLKLVRGFGYVEHSSYDEIPWQEKFGEYECLKLPDDNSLIYCAKYKKSREAVLALRDHNYRDFIRMYDRIKREYGDWVDSLVYWRDDMAPLLVSRFPERFRDKLNRIAEEVTRMLEEDPENYDRDLVKPVYGYSYLKWWAQDLMKLKDYLEPGLRERLEKAVRRAKEILEERRRREEEERRRREEEERRRREETIRSELSRWSGYLELEKSDGKLVVVRRRFMGRQLFEELIRKLRQLGFRFDPRTKQWYIFLHRILRFK